MTAAIRSRPEWAASEISPKLPVAIPTKIFSPVIPTAAMTELRATERFSLRTLSAPEMQEVAIELGTLMLYGCIADRRSIRFACASINFPSHWRLLDSASFRVFLRSTHCQQFVCCCPERAGGGSGDSRTRTKLGAHDCGGSCACCAHTSIDCGCAGEFPSHHNPRCL